MKRVIAIITVVILLACCSFGCAATEQAQERIEIKALILPKFEVGEMSGDDPGEAQHYYEAYCAGGEEYEIENGYENHKLYVKDGVALYVTGMGKVNAALSTSALLSDKRFDFSKAYVLSVGCAGAAYGYGVMGDVFVITAAVDFDLGHRADVRDMEKSSEIAATWYHDSDYDNASCKILNHALTEKVYGMVRDVRLSTTETTKGCMATSFDNAAWAVREPMVLKGTTVTSDSYWKGIHEHRNAEIVVQTYGCPDPYALSEMEDISIAIALERAHMLDRYIIIRDAVDMDVFMNGATPDTLWNPEFAKSLTSDASLEAADIFYTAMENNYRVGSIVIDAILNQTL